MRLVFGKNDVFALLYFVKICGLYVRRRGVCGYGYIHGYPWIYPWISTENLWIWIWMGNFISTVPAVLIQCQGVTDGQTSDSDGQTYERTDG